MAKSIEVSHYIKSPAETIFEIIRNPQKHQEFDGSGMIRGSDDELLLNRIGDRFTMKMHRNGDDYLMINIVVEYEANRRIFWAPAPGDISRATDHDPSNIGKPAGYSWGYILKPDTSGTMVTEVFDYGPLSESLFSDGGKWVNLKNTLEESMSKSLALLEILVRS